MATNFLIYAKFYLVHLVGARGFEPPTSWSRTKRAYQTALRPDKYFTFTMNYTIIVQFIN